MNPDRPRLGRTGSCFSPTDWCRGTDFSLCRRSGERLTGLEPPEMLTITFQTLRSRIGTLASASSSRSSGGDVLLRHGTIARRRPQLARAWSLRCNQRVCVVGVTRPPPEGRGDRAFNAEAAVAPSLPERWVSEVAATESVQKRNEGRSLSGPPSLHHRQRPLPMHVCRPQLGGGRTHAVSA